jgi:hypothetical protein
MQETAAILGFFITVGLIFWIVASNIRRLKTARIVGEMHNKMLDRFSSSQDLVAYLQTDAGKQFLAMGESEPKKSPYGRILGAMQIGVILIALGTALLILCHSFRSGWQEFLAFGSISLALGIGFLAAAALSYRLSKSLGLFDNGKIGSQRG